jgi:predicted Zn-dependent protease
MQVAVIHLNAVSFNWSAGETAQQFSRKSGNWMDLENVITHELGHVLGFGHTQAPGATMRASAKPHETEKRKLMQADINALCDAYPAEKM